MKIWVKIVLGLVAVGIIALFLVYKFVYNKQHPDYENIEPAFTMTAQDLFQAFKTNKDASSAKYNGKMIALTGKLSKIEAADSLVTAVFVFSQGDFGDEGIRCTVLKKFNDAADKLQPDGEVKLKGYCTGYNETDVILDKCSIINQ
ncbi:MAG: OB-fold protein [Bacteroidales bacterium]